MLPWVRTSVVGFTTDEVPDVRAQKPAFTRLYLRQMLGYPRRKRLEAEPSRPKPGGEGG